MQNVLIAFVVAVFISGCASVGSQSVDDVALEKRLQHTWSYREAASSNIIIEGETTYLPGGVVNLFGHIKQNGTVRTILGSGTWYVKDGYLHYTLTKSNMPSMIPNGFASADKIVRVTDNEFAYISSADGKTEIEHRVR